VYEQIGLVLRNGKNNDESKHQQESGEEDHLQTAMGNAAGYRDKQRGGTQKAEHVATQRRVPVFRERRNDEKAYCA
jgi:hypothetical protein